MLSAALLGAFHGINPAMGWLFAVFLALHRKDRNELFRSLLPIAVGHALSVGLIAVVIGLVRSTVSIQALRYASAAILLGFGLFQLTPLARHIPWARLNVNRWELAVWSFLGATAHGSGLMLAPLMLNLPGGMYALWTVLVHTGAMLAVMAVVAVLVHDRLSITKLRPYWVNFHLLWAAALLAAGVFALLGSFGHTHPHVH